MSIGIWFSTEEIFLIANKPRGLLRKYQEGWYAAVGEAYSNEPGDLIVENEFFEEKEKARRWIMARLEARGYLGGEYVDGKRNS